MLQLLDLDFKKVRKPPSSRSERESTSDTPSLWREGAFSHSNLGAALVAIKDSKQGTVTLVDIIRYPSVHPVFIRDEVNWSVRPLGRAP